MTDADRNGVHGTPYMPLAQRGKWHTPHAIGPTRKMLGVRGQSPWLSGCRQSTRCLQSGISSATRNAWVSLSIVAGGSAPI